MALRRHYGISAHEALEVLPVWELDLLIAALDEDQDAAGAGA